MSNAELKVTEFAGLSNEDWQARKEDAVARGQGNIAPVYIERALGSELWDVEGNRYIDFGTGIAVCSAGHCHPKSPRRWPNRSTISPTPASWLHPMTVRCAWLKN